MIFWSENLNGVAFCAFSISEQRRPSCHTATAPSFAFDFFNLHSAATLNWRHCCSCSKLIQERERERFTLLEIRLIRLRLTSLKTRFHLCQWRETSQGLYWVVSCVCLLVFIYLEKDYTRMPILLETSSTPVPAENFIHKRFVQFPNQF